MKKAILLVSYGVTGKAIWEKSLGVLETELKGLWQEWDVYQAFTGRRILEKCCAQGFYMPSEMQAIEKLIGQEYQRIVVLPTHLTFGSEYNRVVAAVNEISVESETTESKIGLPLLGSEVLRQKVAEVLANEIGPEEGEIVLYIGHGTKQDDGEVYELLEKELHDAGQTVALVGTLEAPDAALSRVDGKKVILVPLLLIAGRHAMKDVCGEEEGSIASKLKAAGLEVKCVEKGLIEYEAIRRIYLNQVEELVQSFIL